MDFHLVIVATGDGPEIDLLYLGKDASAATDEYLAVTEGWPMHFRLNEGQAFESRDLRIRHLVSRTEPKPDVAPKPPVLPSELPGPKPGEIVHDPGTGKDFIRPAADPHKLNPLPEHPAARAAAIQEAEAYRDASLASEVAPPDPDRTKQLEDEREAAEKADRERIEAASKPAGRRGPK